MKHPDINKLREVIEAMKAAVSERPELREIDIISVEEPSCGTTGCHAGLAKAALDYLRYPPSEGKYSYKKEADRLARYLGYDLSIDLYDWADSNPVLWGNDRGGAMFSCRTAFDESDRIFPSQHIIGWWEKVLERLEALEKAGGKANDH